MGRSDDGKLEAKITAYDICNAVCRHVFPPRQWVAVPNVSWGWGLAYEADLIAVSKGMWANEVEIKISASDLRADKGKRKWLLEGMGGIGIDTRIKRFWYAVPTKFVELARDPEVVPESCGIIEIKEPNQAFDFPRAEVVRRAKNRKALRVTDEQLQQLLRLGYVRYWDFRVKHGKSVDGLQMVREEPPPNGTSVGELQDIAAETLSVLEEEDDE